jgi:hypothetical protein
MTNENKRVYSVSEVIKLLEEGEANDLYIDLDEDAEDLEVFQANCATSDEPPPSVFAKIQSCKDDIAVLLRRDRSIERDATRQSTMRHIRSQINAQSTWTARFVAEAGWTYTFDQIVAEVLIPALTEVPEVIDGYSIMPNGDWTAWRAHLLTDASIINGWVDAEDEMRGIWRYDVVEVIDRPVDAEGTASEES